MIKYKNQTMLALFVLTLLSCQISFIASELPNSSLFLKRLPFLLLIFSMAFDFFIATGAFSNPKYFLHHLLTAAIALIALIDLNVLADVGIGYFCCYALFGATVKRLRMLRNRRKPHRDKIDTWLKRLYAASNRSDLIVIPLYLILYLSIKSGSTSLSILTMLSLCTASLLFLRYTVDKFHGRQQARTSNSTSGPTRRFVHTNSLTGAI